MSDSTSRRLSEWRWPLTLLGVMGLLVLGGLIALVMFLRQAERAAAGAEDMARGAVDAAVSVAGSFHSGRITERFIASLPEIDASGAGRLELATLDATETFVRADERRVLWDQIPLGTTFAEIRVPVTYRYHLKLEDEWRLEIEGQVCRVIAPKIRPSQPPAIHTDGMERRVDAGWLRWDEAEQLDALQATITPTLRSMARHPTKIAAVRDRSRQVVGRFVRAFLLREGLWSEERIAAIQVVFEGEQVEPETLELSVTIEEDAG